MRFNYNYIGLHKVTLKDFNSFVTNPCFEILLNQDREELILKIMPNANFNN